MFGGADPGWDMAVSAEERAQIDRLVEDYGRYAGLPGLAFDQDGLFALRFDDVEVSVSVEEGGSKLVMRSPLDLSGIRTDASFVATVLTVNVTSMLHGSGVMGIDEEAGTWVWIDHADPRGLTPQTLHVRLLEAVKAIRFWRGKLPMLAGPTEAVAPAAEDFSFTIIRG